jgi:tetratricopeptide (TPR) repeat protein
LPFFNLAIIHYKEAIQYDKLHPKPYLSIGLLEFKRHNVDNALKYLRGGLFANPQAWSLCYGTFSKLL